LQGKAIAIPDHNDSGICGAKACIMRRAVRLAVSMVLSEFFAVKVFSLRLCGEMIFSE
jgi:hypothetical protein